MAKNLEPIEVGVLTPVRRMRSVTLRCDYDQAAASAEPKVTATFEYEVAYPDATGKGVFPAKHDGFAELRDEALRALPNMAQALAELTNAAEAASDEREAMRIEPGPR